MGGGVGLVAVLCALGALVSAYLLAADFVLGSAEFCLTGEGCDAVRGSRYSRVGGVPVSLLGVLGYAAMAAIAVSRLGRRTRWSLLFWLSAAAVGFSAYLTYLELFIIEALCSWCLASAAIAVGVFLLAASQTPRSASAARFLGGTALFVLVFAASHSIHSPVPGENPPSGATFYQASLAKYLSERGATMYGSHACSHCERQKEFFGGAFGHITYVECSRSGPDPNPALCSAKNIRSYPTWEIGGEFHEGVMTLEQLGRISGYSGE